MLVNFGMKRGLLLLSLLVFLLFVMFSVVRRTSSGIPSLKALAQAPKKSWMCGTYPDDGSIAISIKTGATEASRKLPALLKTTLSCVQDLMVFSDLTQSIAGLQIHDVLSRVELNITKGNPDFDIYRKQRQLLDENREDDLDTLATMPAPPGGPETEGKNAAWSLDKYKFIHMLERAYALQPRRDWYVFLEADTYLSWPNLKRWLATQDPQSKVYFGNALRKVNGRPPVYFAHGGSGFILSGAAMKEIAVDRAGMARRTDPVMRNWGAGDIMLADTLFKETRLQVTNVWPMLFHQDPDLEAPLGEEANVPAITAHSVQEEESKRIYELELEFEFNASGIRFQDIYTTLSSDEMDDP